LTRKFKSHLLISRETFTKAVGGHYIKRDIGLVRVKGKQERVPVVEIIGHANDGVVNPELYDRFAHLTELLHDRKQDEARTELGQLKELMPTDGVIHMYDEKFKELKELPAEMVFEFDTK
jgi:hypothetical protein